MRPVPGDLAEHRLQQAGEGSPFAG
jgi:hypothetical protein